MSACFKTSISLNVPNSKLIYSIFISTVSLSSYDLPDLSPLNTRISKILKPIVYKIIIIYFSSSLNKVAFAVKTDEHAIFTSVTFPLLSAYGNS